MSQDNEIVIGMCLISAGLAFIVGALITDSQMLISLSVLTCFPGAILTIHGVR